MSAGDRKKNHRNKETVLSSSDFEMDVEECFTELLSSSGPGPRSGPDGPETKDQRPGPGLNIKFGLSPPTTKLFFGR